MVQLYVTHAVNQSMSTWKNNIYVGLQWIKQYRSGQEQIKMVQDQYQKGSIKSLLN